MPRSASPGWPFVGRDPELRAVRDALESDGAVVVAGPAGVGKSRLARELVARVARGAVVGIAPASASSREIPLGVFAPWLGDDREPATEVSALVRAGESLRAGGPRSVLLVDDAHMLDAVSATLLHQLAADRALRLVVTVRTGEPTPDAVTALWKDGLARRIEIDALDADAVGRLLDAALDGPVDAQARSRLYDVSRGNVLWLRHVVEGERAAGRLARDDGRWRWVGAPSLSPALEHLVDARIGTLDAGERHVLELVALGEPIGLDMLVELTGEREVERAAERELVVVVTDGARSEVRLGHPLYGEAVRGRLSLPRARRLRGELSRALRATGGRRAGDDLRRAVFDLGSDTPPDASLLLLAASQAMTLTDYRLSERLLRAAIDAGGGFDALLTLAFLMSWLLRIDEAEEMLALAVAEADTDAQRGRATISQAHLLFFILDRGDDARALVGAPDARTVTDLDAVRATMLTAAGDAEEGYRLGTAVVAAGLSSQATAWACWSGGYAGAYAGGHGTEVADLVARGMEAAQRSPETIALLGNLGFAEILEAGLSGDLERGRARVEWIESLPGDHAATWAALYRGRLSLDRGCARTATRLIDSIVPSFPGHGGGWTAWFHALIAQGHAMSGETTQADASVREAEKTRHPEVRLAESDLGVARAWVAASRGAVAEALAHLEDVATAAGRRGQKAVEVVARQTATRLGDRRQAGRLAVLAHELGTPRARAAAHQAVALAAEDADGLLAAADAFEVTGLLLDAADAAAQAAVVAREQHQAALALTAAERAAALGARCENASTPALEAARAPLPLSGREREVAVLAAEGLTNRQIAARLQVSIRTVESHVYRACTRLGLPDRAALAAAVAPNRHGEER